jgi:hypothetical protein
LNGGEIKSKEEVGEKDEEDEADGEVDDETVSGSV